MKTLLLLIAIIANFGLAEADGASVPIQDVDELTFVIHNGWMLTIRANGSAVLAFGSNIVDKAESPEGTFSFQRVYDAFSGRLKKKPGVGDVAVIIRVVGATSTVAEYIDRLETRWIFSEAQKQCKALDQTRFDALLKNNPIDKDIP